MSADLGRLLPHRPPMLLLDRVEEATRERGVTGWTVPQGAPWVAQGRLVRSAFVEIAAQTAMAAAAAAGELGGHGERRAGTLAAVPFFRVVDDAHAGERLRCTTRVVAHFGALVRVACRVERVDEDGVDVLLAEGELTVASAGPSL